MRRKRGSSNNGKLSVLNSDGKCNIESFSFQSDVQFFAMLCMVDPGIRAGPITTIMSIDSHKKKCTLA